MDITQDSTKIKRVITEYVNNLLQKFQKFR